MSVFMTPDGRPFFGGTYFPRADFLGLLKAVDGFNPDLATDFGAYALPTVLGELKRYFRDKGWGVRVPRRLQELRLEINACRDELTQKLGRSPTVADLAAHLGRPEDDVIEALVAASGYRPSSLDELS